VKRNNVGEGSMFLYWQWAFSSLVMQFSAKTRQSFLLVYQPFVHAGCSWCGPALRGMSTPFTWSGRRSAKYVESGTSSVLSGSVCHVMSLALRIFLLGQPSSLDLSAGSSKLSRFTVCVWTTKLSESISWEIQTLCIFVSWVILVLVFTYLLGQPSFLDLYLLGHPFFGSVCMVIMLSESVFLVNQALQDMSDGSSKLSRSVCWVNQALWIYLLRNPSSLYLCFGSSKFWFIPILWVIQAVWFYHSGQPGTLDLYLLGHPFFGSVCKVIQALLDDPEISGSVCRVNYALWICLLGHLCSLDPSGRLFKLSVTLVTYLCWVMQAPWICLAVYPRLTLDCIESVKQRWHSLDFFLILVKNKFDLALCGLAGFHSRIVCNDELSRG